MSVTIERAAELLESYADFIRRDVISADIERHPYLPDIEECAVELRQALAAVPDSSATGAVQVATLQVEGVAGASKFEVWLAQGVFSAPLPPGIYPLYAGAPPSQQASSRRADLVPGVMHCAKCKFQLNRVTLCVSDGNAYAGDNKTEPCPNGCGPLWPVTWEQEARKSWTALEEMHEKLVAANAPRWIIARQHPSRPEVSIFLTSSAPDARRHQRIGWTVLGIDGAPCLDPVGFGAKDTERPNNAVLVPCDQLTELQKDAARLEWLETEINEHGQMHLHDGAHPHGTGLGLRPGTISRTLRQAIDDARGIKSNGAEKTA